MHSAPMAASQPTTACSRDIRNPIPRSRVTSFPRCSISCEPPVMERNLKVPSLQRSGRPAGCSRCKSSTGAFPGGLHESAAKRSPQFSIQDRSCKDWFALHAETNRPEILEAAALAAADWLIEMQQADGSWCGPVAYQNTAHTYYSMVAWAMAELVRTRRRIVQVNVTAWRRRRI